MNGTRSQEHVETAIELQALHLGDGVANNISVDATHVYRLGLSNGQQVRILFDKGDLNLQAVICEPAGGTCEEFNRLRYGPLEIPFTAKVTGEYHLKVRALEGDSATRPYQLHVTAADAPQLAEKQSNLALRAFSQAEQLYMRWEEPSLRAAVEKYVEASRLWQSAGMMGNSAEALRIAGDVQYTLSEYRQSLDYYSKALKLSQGAGDRRGVTTALNSIGYTYIYLGDDRNAETYAQQALADARSARAAGGSVEDTRAEAQALNNLGEVYYSRGDLRKSVELFERALTIWIEAGNDRRGEALARLNIGYSLTDQGEIKKADEHYQRALALWQATNQRDGVALARNAIGAISSLLGENQLALTYHKEAADLFRTMGNQYGYAVALNGVAAVYENLNEHLIALDNHEQALRIYEQIGNRDFAAVTKLRIGQIYSGMGNYDRALAYYQQSIELSRGMGLRRIQALTLRAIGAAYDGMGRKQDALKQFVSSQSLYREMGDRRGELNALNSTCHIYADSGEQRKALLCFNEAMSLARSIMDRPSEALVRFNLARVERDGGDIKAALSNIKESIDIVESLHSEIASGSLRMLYFTSVHQYYDLYVDLLMRLHRQDPNGGFDEAALLVSERGRARSLLESLVKDDSLREKGGDQSLLQRSRELQQALATKAEYQVRLLNGTRNEEELQEVEGDVRALLAEYQAVKAQISEQNPRYASLTRPESLSLEHIQRALTDENTILLEFALGEDRSYLWAVTPTTINSFELPARKTIEDAVREVYKLLTARQDFDVNETPQYAARVEAADAQYWPRALALSQMLLGPVANQLGTKRLLIVSDGLLQYIPFDALPDPRTGETPMSTTSGATSDPPTPLVLNHEIVGLPSALFLTTQRLSVEVAAPKTIAVFADPVFSVEDPRVSVPSYGDASAKELNNATSSNREDLALPTIKRLPYTSKEANNIASLLPRGEAMVATGFGANRASVLAGGLNGYRIVHFATPSIINNEHPELSGVILSLVDKNGNAQDGFIRLQDIYDLDLTADLIVLSACETGLGRNISGEGAISLTRGFLYAGSESVVGSLWKNEDQATSELMTDFYRAIFKDGLTPATALRAAKITMLRQARWRAPYYWASFVIQGEYREHISAAPTERGWGTESSLSTTLVLSVLAVSGGLGALWYLLRRRRRWGNKAANCRNAPSPTDRGA